jgi:hypothetical protein
MKGYVVDICLGGAFATAVSLRDRPADDGLTVATTQSEDEFEIIGATGTRVSHLLITTPLYGDWVRIKSCDHERGWLRFAELLEAAAYIDVEIGRGWRETSSS